MYQRQGKHGADNIGRGADAANEQLQHIKTLHYDNGKVEVAVNLRPVRGPAPVPTANGVLPPIPPVLFRPAAPPVRGHETVVLRVAPGRLGLSLFFPAEEGRLPFVTEMPSVCPFRAELKVGDELASVDGMRITRSQQFLSLRADADRDFVFARIPTVLPKARAAARGQSQTPRGACTKKRKGGGAPIPAAMKSVAKLRRTNPSTRGPSSTNKEPFVVIPGEVQSSRCRKMLEHRQMVLDRVKKIRVVA